LEQTQWRMVHDWQFVEEPDRLLDKIMQDLEFPLFIKPSSQGSSVGISKAHDREGLSAAITEALRFDYKAMIEQSIEDAHEVECAVLGNDRPCASVVGEIIPGAEFYNYQTKYIDDKSQLVIPAELPAEFAEQIRAQSILAFEAVSASGLSRVDFLVRPENNQIVINEINTMPGFTPISMYPKLWQHSGIEYADLIDRLVDLGIARHQSKTDRNSGL
jgi:D-alanine-D-alanine ligase